MGKKTLTFSDIEIEKHKFYRCNSPIFLKDVSTKNVLVSKKISSGEKNCRYLICYLYDDYKNKPLHIILPITRAYVKCYDHQTK